MNRRHGAGRGRVYLVGAGPGDPGLISVRGLELIESADVILYDRLVARELLAAAPADAEKVFVGKKPGEAHSRQIVADALMIDRAQDGKRVIRLKGGDPFVFGRGGEELELLAAAGVAFEVVPGVSSAIAAASYAGIPVTHRSVASSFAVLTANEEADAAIHWDEMAGGPDTLVLMMGVRSLRSTARKLMNAGRPPDQPAAIVEWATTPLQRVVTGTLETLADLAHDAGIKSPATAFIGDVVRLRDTIAWFEMQPLYGLRVVVTRAAATGGDFTKGLTESGAAVLYFPTIAISDPASFEDVDYAIRKMSDGLYAWVVFTSANAIEKFFARVTASGLDARALARAKVAVVGSASADLLRAHGIEPDLVPEVFTGATTAEMIGRGSGKVLLPRVEDAPREIIDTLVGSGWSPDEVVTYRNTVPEASEHALETIRSGQYDVVTFTSASTVTGFVTLAGDPEELGLAPDSEALRFVACIGPKTATAAKEAGMRVDIVARENTGDGLLDAIEQHFRGAGHGTMEP